MLIARIFPHPCGARKTTMQLTKYPHVLYAKPSNKVYVNDKTKTQDEYFFISIYVRKWNLGHTGIWYIFVHSLPNSN